MTHAPNSFPDGVPPETGEAQRVERAAACLSAMEREILVLSAGQSMRIEEIAGRLGLSHRRTERLLARALRKFDRAINDRPPPWWRLWRW